MLYSGCLRQNAPIRARSTAATLGTCAETKVRLTRGACLLVAKGATSFVESGPLPPWQHKRLREFLYVAVVDDLLCGIAGRTFAHESVRSPSANDEASYGQA